MTVKINELYCIPLISNQWDLIPNKLFFVNLQLSSPLLVLVFFTYSPVSLSSVVNENLDPKTPLYQSSEAPAAGSEDKILLFSGQTLLDLHYSYCS